MNARCAETLSCPFFSVDEKKLTVKCNAGVITANIKLCDRDELKNLTRCACVSDKWRDCSIADFALMHEDIKPR